MTRKYNLESSTSDRAEFDRIQEQYAVAMLEALTEAEALAQDPEDYAKLGWEAFEIDLELGSIKVDNLDEAKARFFDAFKQGVHDWQIERTKDNLEEELYQKEKGFVTAIEVMPGGQKDGLSYGPAVIEIVILDNDGNTIAYRYSDDSVDHDWQLGYIEDAAKEAIDCRHQHYEVEREIEEEAKLMASL